MLAFVSCWLEVFFFLVSLSLSLYLSLVILSIGGLNMRILLQMLDRRVVRADCESSHTCVCVCICVCVCVCICVSRWMAFGAVLDACSGLEQILLVINGSNLLWLTPGMNDSLSSCRTDSFAGRQTECDEANANCVTYAPFVESCRWNCGVLPFMWIWSWCHFHT